MSLVTHRRTWHPTIRKKDYPKEYAIWYSMLKRCYVDSEPSYKNYGGRNIVVCDRWRERFSNFVTDMGRKPENSTLERVDNNGPYSPVNCRWATRAEQNRNTRRTRLFTHGGKTLCMSDWAKELGISKYSILARLKKGWTLEKAILTPTQPGKKKTLPGGGYI